jgi:hypothetical protein
MAKPAATRNLARLPGADRRGFYACAASAARHMLRRTDVCVIADALIMILGRKPWDEYAADDDDFERSQETGRAWRRGCTRSY